MGAPQYEQAGADIGGTGTTNTIPRWTGASTLGDSGLIDNGTAIYTTTRNVGIGAATAPAKLSVIGNLIAHTTAGAYTNYGWQASFYDAAQSKGVAICYNTSPNGNLIQGLGAAGSNSDLNLNVYGGNVGIGTASPSAQLHISRAGGTSNAEYIRLTNTTVATNSACGITFFQNNAAVPVNRIEGTVSAAGSYDLVSYAWNGSSTAEVMRLQGSTGNVGIGTASPGYRLHVKDATNRNMIMTSGTTGMKITSLTDAGAEADIGVQGNTVQFLTGGTERARIDSNGNIYGTSGTTGMTNGFFYIPAAAGAPTGVPTAVAGRVPMYYDTTNNQFYVYNGAWKKVTLA